MEAYFAFFNTWAVLCKAGLFRRIVGYDMKLKVGDHQIASRPPPPPTGTILTASQQREQEFYHHPVPCARFQLVWDVKEELTVYLEQVWAFGKISFFVSKITGSSVLGSYTERTEILLNEAFDTRNVRQGGYAYRINDPPPPTFSNLLVRVVKALRGALQPVFYFPKEEAETETPPPPPPQNLTGGDGFATVDPVDYDLHMHNYRR